MKEGNVALILLGVLLFVTVVGGVAYVGAKKFGFFEQPRKFDSSLLNNSTDKISSSPDTSSSETSTFANNVALASPSPSPTPAASPIVSFVYKQPEGKYTITLPGNYSVGGPTATQSYSTTKFTGPSGYVSITFGSGKDPLGGCSDPSTIILADRNIPGCFLLQKDGSQILTRAYTNDKAGLPFTIEAYINPPLASSRDVILAIVKTISIN